MSRDKLFDRFYAARHVRILIRPSHELETFDSTLVNYHLISELEDNPGKVRIREGRLEAHKPLVITPSADNISMIGFGEAAREYVDFLKEHMRILRYGYHLKSDNFSEQIVTDSLAAVTERVKSEVRKSGDRFSAVLQGVDNPWDVALVELWRTEVERAAPHDIKNLSKKGELF